MRTHPYIAMDQAFHHVHICSHTYRDRTNPLDMLKYSLHLLRLLVVSARTDVDTVIAHSAKRDIALLGLPISEHLQPVASKAWQARNLTSRPSTSLRRNPHAVISNTSQYNSLVRDKTGVRKPDKMPSGRRSGRAAARRATAAMGKSNHPCSFPDAVDDTYWRCPARDMETMWCSASYVFLVFI